MIFCFVVLFCQISTGTDEKWENPNCEKSTTLFKAKFLRNVQASEGIKLRSKKNNFFHFWRLLPFSKRKGKWKITRWGITSTALFRWRQSSGNPKSRRKKKPTFLGSLNFGVRRHTYFGYYWRFWTIDGIFETFLYHIYMEKCLQIWNRSTFSMRFTC